MNFYEFHDNSPFESKWTYAVKIHPTSHAFDWCCTACGRAQETPSGSFMVTVEGGTSYPDFLGCGAYPFLIVSDRVVAAWNKNGINVFRIFSVEVSHVLESQLKLTSAPKYYRVEICGECRVDFAESGASIQSICERCGEITIAIPYIKHFAILEGSWDGNALFRDQRYFPCVNFCTDLVKDICQSEGFSNVRFKALSSGTASRR